MWTLNELISSATPEATGDRGYRGVLLKTETPPFGLDRKNLFNEINTLIRI